MRGLSARGGMQELAGAIAPEELARQFVLGQEVRFRPDGWVESRAGGWSLVRDPALPVVGISDRAGRWCGWLLGFPLRLGDGVRDTPLGIDADAGDPRFVRLFEDALYAHAGSFAAVLLEPEPRVYVDCYGSLPVHYEPELGLVSSSPFLLSEDGSVVESPVSRELDVTRTNLWHILGTSPLAGGGRLVPNHRLDLAGWRPVRIWPLGSLGELDADAALDEATSAIAGSIAAAAADGGANISITAGGDTRLLLACSGPVLERLTFFTAELPDVLGEIDRLTVRKLVSRFGLPHVFLPWVPAGERDVALWLYRTGLTVGEGRGRTAGPTYAQLDGSRPYVSGVGGVLAVGGRDFATRNGHAPSAPVSAEELVTGFHFPSLREFLAAADRWLAELPAGLDRPQTHALFRCEMYYGCWGGPLALGYPESTRYVLYPNAQRRVIEAALRLPLDYRLTGRGGLEAIRRLRPELLDVPINHPTLRLRLRREARLVAEKARAGRRRLGARRGSRTL